MFQQGDVVRFCTMDGSPQHGYDWVLHGSITVSVAECVVLFHLAIEYIGLSLDQGPAPEDANNRTRELCPAVQVALPGAECARRGRLGESGHPPQVAQPRALGANVLLELGRCCCNGIVQLLMDWGFGLRVFGYAVPRAVAKVVSMGK